MTERQINKERVNKRYGRTQLYRKTTTTTTTTETTKTLSNGVFLISIFQVLSSGSFWDEPKGHGHLTLFVLTPGPDSFAPTSGGFAWGLAERKRRYALLESFSEPRVARGC